MTQTTAVERIAAILRQELERAYSVDFGYNGIMGIPAASVRIFYEVIPHTDSAADIDRLQRELAEARAFISTIIDAPKDYPAEESA